MPATPSPRNARQVKNGTLGTKAVKPVDFGKAIGIDKPANIRDKIKRWQIDFDAEGEGENEEPTEEYTAPAAEPEPAPASAAASSPKLPASPKLAPSAEALSPPLASTPTKSLDATPEKTKSAKKLPHNKLDDDVRQAIAPKKRVVSDSHWRNKKSPPKDSATKPSPKPLPTAWVRPALKPRDKADTKAPVPLDPKPLLLFTTKPAPLEKPRPRPQRQSRPSSSGNDERPGSSGSVSATGVKSGEDDRPSSRSPVAAEKVAGSRRRRRRRSGNSPRGSVSAEDFAPVKKYYTYKSPHSSTDDLSEGLKTERRRSHVEVTVEERRERRRSYHTREHPTHSPDEARDPPSSRRRRSHRKSYSDLDQERPPPPVEPTIPETPPKQFGSRLESWLSQTPDPFVDAGSRTRRLSKESVSTLELTARKTERSEVSDTTGCKASILDAVSERKSNSSSSSSKQRRVRSTTLSVDTKDLAEQEDSILSSEASEAAPPKDGPEISPSLTLKRRGARRNPVSPTKDRARSSPLRESSIPGDDATSSAPSSSVDASALDVEQLPWRPKPEKLAMRRIFPSTGKRLSTIASADTLSSFTEPLVRPGAVGSEVGSEADKQIAYAPASEVGTTLSRRSTKRRLASHADLISVLSMPRAAGTKSIVSARSIRTNRSRLATATISDIMDELASDETKYMRELRTLVDGVIPVLLSCVLSKSDSAAAAGLFSRSASTNPTDVTKPIIDMGVALERLKSVHRRVPKDNPDTFLSWAVSAQKVYSDYIKCWRLGFQDVVVNLAPADEDSSALAKTIDGPDGATAWDEGLPRNAEGYVVNGEGERVDVAYMLKRPLVRLKYLAKTMKGINHVKPSEQAEKMSNVFADLVADARKRSNDERARLEDDAANNVDPTRARDPKSLAPLTGVRIDASRNVRARDYFDMHLLHSSGQEVNCRVELLLRDNPPGAGDGGDVLICEVDPTGRWLFLPPISQKLISARNGDTKGEIIVMIRGFHSDGQEWHEVFSLRSEDEEAGFEWVQMLGLNPIPPQLAEVKREASVVHKAPRPTSSSASSSLVSGVTGSTLPQKSRTPSPHEIEIPIGEKATSTSRKWGYETPDRSHHSPEVSPVTPPSSDRTKRRERNQESPISPPGPVEAPYRAEDGSRTPSSQPTSRHGEDEFERTPRSLNDAMQLAGNGSPGGLKRTKATKRLSKNPPQSPVSSRPSRQIILDDDSEPEERPRSRKLSKRRPSEKRQTLTSSSLSHTSKGFSVWMPSSDVEYSDESDEEQYPKKDDHEPPKRPQAHRRASSVPSMDLPTIPKLRKTSQPSTPAKTSEEEGDVKEAPASAPAKLRKKSRVVEPVHEEEELHKENDAPPPVPPHRSASPATPVTLKASNTPVFTPSLPGYKSRRRSSSPLKHEYEPSTATESSSESEEEASLDDEESLTSGSSEDELDDDVPTPLMPIGQGRFSKVSPPSSIYTLPNGTITPSQSASNTPYRTVPKTSTEVSKTVATISTWNDSEGRWVSLHPDECSIVVTPGKIEAFEMSAEHSKPFTADGDDVTPEGRAPLIGLELTIHVGLRKGTALDITVRSPPTADSRLKRKCGQNFMFRSRNPAECQQLYELMNVARINNPTYIALQNARGPYGQTSWAETMDRNNAARANAESSGGWFSGTLGRRSSYRNKTSTRAVSVSAVTESSVGTMGTGIRSALNRFSFGRNKRFNINGSTLGSRSTNSFDSGSGSGSGTSTPVDGGRAPGAPPGITNTKIRLYEREAHAKWSDLGSARLTIMLPDPSTPHSSMRQGKGGSGSPGARNPMQEKRILIVGKTKGETLLDVTLSESCFERIARTGIAVSVWEDFVGPNGEIGTVGAVGGVSGARARVYMIQMKSERECAYSFSLLGKLRY